MFSQAEGQAGAAGWMLQAAAARRLAPEQAVAGTTQLDAVHRMVGRPGIVLVGEGAPHRVRGLIAQEKKKIARVAGDTPIYDIIVGTGEGDLRLAKLNRYLVKLPANLTKEQVAALDKRSPRWRPGPLPQGPMPAGAKMRNVQRTVRRRQLTGPMTGPQPTAASGSACPQDGPGSLAPTGPALRAFLVDPSRRPWSRRCSSRSHGHHAGHRCPGRGA